MRTRFSRGGSALQVEFIYLYGAAFFPDGLRSKGNSGANGREEISNKTSLVLIGF
jgi:hypothetical protein